MPTETFQSSAIPPRPLHKVAAQVLADLCSSREALVAAGVSLPSDSRADQAIDVLEHAVKTGALIPEHRGDHLGLRALETGFDISVIASTLPNPFTKDLRTELRDALTGPLDPPEDKRGPLQLQSQFVVRSALVKTGSPPSHPPPAEKKKGSTPDLLISDGLSEYALEAKRPQLSKNIGPRFLEGRDQLVTYGRPGAVLVDVSDCIKGPGAVVDDFVATSARSLFETVFVDGVGYKPGFESIMVAGTFARAAWYSQEGAGEALIYVHTSSCLCTFSAVGGSIRHHHAKNMRKRFESGLTQLNITLEELLAGVHPN